MSVALLLSDTKSPPSPSSAPQSQLSTHSLTTGALTAIVVLVTLTVAGFLGAFWQHRKFLKDRGVVREDDTTHGYSMVDFARQALEASKGLSDEKEQKEEDTVEEQED